MAKLYVNPSLDAAFMFWRWGVDCGADFLVSFVVQDLSFLYFSFLHSILFLFFMIKKLL